MAFPPVTVRPIIRSSASNLAISFACCAAAFGFAAQPVRAQDSQPEPTLEDLIPDSAVSDPDSWATQGTDATGADVTEAEVAEAADAEMPDLPGIEVPWPDDAQVADFTPSELDMLESDGETVEFADLETGEAQLVLVDGETDQISQDLVLGFPQGDPPFLEKDELLDRFKALSTVRELDTDDDNVAQLAARAREDEELLYNLMRVYGYYDGQVVRSIGSREAGDDNAADRPVVRFDVIPGTRYKFGAIDLGALNTAPDHDSLRAAFEIQTGDFMSSDKIVEEQFDLDRALGETGYPFAVIDEPQLLIDHDRIEGDLTLPVKPNGKYVFGDVISSDPEFLSSEHLGVIARFDPGDGYKRSLEQDLRRAIVATGLVSTVTVTPREVTPAQGDQPGVVAMDVALERAPLRTIAGAIGYGSEEGIRVEASWEHRNFFPPEGMLRVRGIIGTQEQLAGVTFRKNNFGGRDRALTVDAYASTIDSKAFYARTLALVGTFERTSTLLFQKPISWSIGGELVATQERPAEVDGVTQPLQDYFIAALPAYIQLDTTNDLLDPNKGFRVSARLSPEISRTNGTESFYLRSQFDASYYQQVTDKVVVAGRATFGSIPGTDLENIAPSRRFYAGGGGSVRGYGYRAIGPRNDLGEPSGGRSLVELAVEARIKTGFFDGALSVVPFIDAGSVGTGQLPDFEEIRVGAGLGIRYQTGFGPIRVDVGMPINKTEYDSPVAVYVSLGQAF